MTQGILEREIAKAKKAKADHSGEKAGRSGGGLGFTARKWLLKRPIRVGHGCGAGTGWDRGCSQPSWGNLDNAPRGLLLLKDYDDAV